MKLILIGVDEMGNLYHNMDRATFILYLMLIGMFSMSFARLLDPTETIQLFSYNECRFLNLMDWLLTMIVIRYSAVGEGNPIMQGIVEKNKWFQALIFKILFMEGLIYKFNAPNLFNGVGILFFFICFNNSMLLVRVWIQLQEMKRQGVDTDSMYREF